MVDPEPRRHSPQLSRTTSPTHTTSRVISRDYAADRNEATSPSRLRVRTSRISFRPASVRRRVGSIRTTVSANPSPAPTGSWRDYPDFNRRSVAVAGATGRDNDSVSRKFSLAGPPPADAVAANQTYVDPGYAQLNPAYDQPSNARPVWGLAKPLPRVLRPGMVPAEDEVERELDEEREERENGSVITDLESGRIEPSLRPDKVSSQLDSLRRERELSLFRAYRHLYPGSPELSPFGAGRRSSDAPTERPERPERPDFHAAIDEEAEYSDWENQEPPDLELPHLRQAIDNVKRARAKEESEVPYQDAVPLPAYDTEGDEVHNLHTYWSIIRLRFREPFAEFLAVYVQYTLGFTVNLAVTIARAPPADTANWAWGFAAMVAIYIAGGVSGAQLNPAISFVLYIYRGFPLRKIPVYLPAQMLAGFLATMTAYAIYRPGLIALMEEQQLSLVKQHRPESLSLSRPRLASLPSSTVLVNFITYPRTHWVNDATAFLTEFIGTIILTVAIFALGDDTNAPPGAGMNAFIVGLLVVALGMCLAPPTGLALNPNRDFSPRVALTVLGYNEDNCLWADGYWFRVAWLGPILGAIVGGLLYDAAIFVGGESPVNYPAVRIKRATVKWKKRWQARLRRTKKKVKTVKDGAMSGGYEPVDG